MTVQYAVTKKHHRRAQLYHFYHSAPGLGIVLGFFALSFFSALFLLPGDLAAAWPRALLLAGLTLILICAAMTLTILARTALLFQTDDGAFGSCELHFGEKEITALSPSSAQSFSYASLSRLRLSGSALHLFFGVTTGFALPITAFSDAAETEAILARIEKKAGKRLRPGARARLLRRVGKTG